MLPSGGAAGRSLGAPSSGLPFSSTGTSGSGGPGAKSPALPFTALVNSQQWLLNNCRDDIRHTLWTAIGDIGAVSTPVAVSLVGTGAGVAGDGGGGGDVGGPVPANLISSAL